MNALNCVCSVLLGLKLYSEPEVTGSDPAQETEYICVLSLPIPVAVRSKV